MNSVFCNRSNSFGKSVHMIKFVVALALVWLGLLAFMFGMRANLDPSRHNLHIVPTDRGEITQKKAVGVTGLYSRPSTSQEVPWIETLSWKPRAFLYHNFITAEEAKEIIALGEKHVTQSLVVSDQGKNVQSGGRTSNGVFLMGNFMAQSPLLRYLEKRIADWTQLPIENGEAFYLLRYETGQEYKAHSDYFPPGKLSNGEGNRYATVIVYLQTPEEGGDTVFPNVNVNVKAIAGNALLFYDLNTTWQGDTNSLHAGQPVIKGTKWAMTKWIREKKHWYWYNYLSKEEQAKIDEEDKLFLQERRKVQNPISLK